MAYDNLEHLRKVEDVKKIAVPLVFNDGIKRRFVWLKHIKDTFHIRFDAFCHYLNTNVPIERNKTLKKLILSGKLTDATKKEYKEEIEKLIEKMKENGEYTKQENLF